MRMILSITARHLARLRSAQAMFYHSLANDHAAAAFPEVTSMLTQLNEENSQALYYATVLICLSSFAKDPTPGNLLIVAEEGEVPWWALMRGVRMVVNTVGINRILAETSDALLTGTSTWNDQALKPVASEPEELQWEKPLEQVADLVTEMLAPGEKTHYAALGHLQERYQLIFRSPEKPSVDNGKAFTIVFAWLFVLEEDFIVSVENRHPVALLLLAYYGVLLRRLEHYWFMAGWSRQIVTGVSRLLSPQYTQLLQWPMEQVGLLQAADELQL
ncbi:C6 finger domain-containing protein [Colletotrichum tofieldiae]|nr:C6 finger domain-containing protein [Colletotrichum tofieldiae]GKT74139.1 C6 finger domain-containing protein [Colletotrichum tofieldiae]